MIPKRLPMCIVNCFSFSDPQVTQIFCSVEVHRYSVQRFSVLGFMDLEVLGSCQIGDKPGVCSFSSLCKAVMHRSPKRALPLQHRGLHGVGSAIHHPPRRTEFGDVYDHAGRTFTRLGDSDRARRHSRFHPAVRLVGYYRRKINKRKATLNLSTLNVEP